MSGAANVGDDGLGQRPVYLGPSGVDVDPRLGNRHRETAFCAELVPTLLSRLHRSPGQRRWRRSTYRQRDIPLFADADDLAANAILVDPHSGETEQIRLVFDAAVGRALLENCEPFLRGRRLERLHIGDDAGLVADHRRQFLTSDVLGERPRPPTDRHVDVSVASDRAAHRLKRYPDDRIAMVDVQLLHPDLPDLDTFRAQGGRDALEGALNFDLGVVVDDDDIAAHGRSHDLWE